MGRTVGIDLGATYSVVAIADESGPRVLDSREGHPLVRSAVSVNRRGELVAGDTAYDRWESAPADTIPSLRRRPVTLGGKEYSPSETGAVLLGVLKEDAERRLDEPVTGAVVTVPAFLSQAERQSVQEAARLAGFEHVSLLDAAPAAVVASMADAIDTSEPKSILVFDLGGEKFEVSTHLCVGGTVAPLALEGDRRLGGDDFDNAIVERVIRRVQEEHGYRVDREKDARFLAALQREAQHAKEKLSVAPSASLMIPGRLHDSSGNPLDVEMDIEREEFEDLVRPLVDRTVTLTEKVVRDSVITPDGVDLVLMVGGGSCVPLVRRSIEGMLGPEKIVQRVHHKHCVALGAAIHAARLRGAEDLPATEVVHGCEVAGCAPFHYGVQEADDRFHAVIHKGDPYPTANPPTLVVRTSSLGQRLAQIPIVSVADLERAGEYELQGTASVALPPGLPAGTSMHVTLALDRDGCLDVSARLADGAELESNMLRGAPASLEFERAGLVTAASDGVRQVEELVRVHGSAEEIERFTVLRRFVETGPPAGSIAEMRQVVSHLDSLRDAILARQPGFWAEALAHLALQPYRERDRDEVDVVIAEGHRAMSRGDLPVLQRAAQRLAELHAWWESSGQSSAMAADSALGGGSGPVIREQAYVPAADVIFGLDRLPIEVPPRASAPPRREAVGRRGKPEMPATLTDRVHFSVTAPPVVAPGSSFVLDVWAHLEEQRAEVVRRARETVAGGLIYVKEKGPVRIARGTILTVRVQAEGLVIADPQDTILWEGTIGTATFPVQVPADAQRGARAADVRFYVEGLEVAKLHFVLTVGEATGTAQTLQAEQSRHRKAFASYASEDRDDVLSIIQGIQKGNPGLDMFFAEASLRSGERWQERLWEEIDRRDIFYLFWSLAASRSDWVRKEWRCAYERRGVGFIDPVPLIAPDLVPPPQELAGELHFNDWVLAFKRRALPAN
jgi:molecular chaperone DnaK